MPTEANLYALVRQAKALFADLTNLGEDPEQSAATLTEIEQIVDVLESGLFSTKSTGRLRLVVNRKSLPKGSEYELAEFLRVRLAAHGRLMEQARSAITETRILLERLEHLSSVTSPRWYPTNYEHSVLLTSKLHREQIRIRPNLGF